MGRIMPSPHVRVLIPRAHKYVTLHSKRDLVDVIKLKTLRWGDYPGLSGLNQRNHRGPYKGRREAGRSEL